MFSINANMIQKQRLEMQLNLFREKKFGFLHPGIEFTKKDQALQILTDNVTSELAYGGAKGGGKSRVGTDWQVLSALAYPGIKQFIGREERTRLMASTYKTFLNTCSDLKIPSWAWKLDGKYNVVTWYNGSSIDLLNFAYEPSDPLYERFGSQEYTNGWLEEGGEIDAGAYDTANVIVGRQPDIERQYNIRSKLYVSLNPKKNWVYHRFYLPNKQGTLAADIKYLPVLAHENPYNTADYLKKLDNIPDPIQRARLRDGKWEYENSETALFTYPNILAMFNGTNTAVNGDIFVTCDPSRQGKDLCVIMVWSGYVVKELHISEKPSIPEIVERLQYIEKVWCCKRGNVIIDDIGVGGGVVDYMPNCIPFISSKVADDEGKLVQKFQNIRVQTFYRAHEKVRDGVPSVDPNFQVFRFGMVQEKSITPHVAQKMLTEELETIFKTSDDDDKLYKITSKEEMKKTLRRSPDIADSFAMRFYYDVAGINNNREFRSASVPYAKDSDLREFEDFVGNFEFNL
jgi:phage terminase large subunit